MLKRIHTICLSAGRPALDGEAAGTRSRGSVILIVLITLLFAATALTLFIEKASTDLLIDAREADASRLRLEAYSALETSLGVLADFNQVIGGLRNPSEGWSDPLGFANYTPSHGRTIDIQFEDESAKISLPTANASSLIAVFQSWNMPQANAERLADAILGWTQANYVPATASAPRPEDYERQDPAFDPPGRALRSYDELASIDYARTVLYDENGLPNDLWRQFVATFSLYSYQNANINGGNPGAIAALGVQDPTQSKIVQDFLHGTGQYENHGPAYFRNGTDVSSLLGATSPAMQLSTKISALRIIITVHEGKAAFRLNAVVAPQGGAKIPPADNPSAANANSPNGQNLNGAPSTAPGGTATNNTSTTTPPPARAVPTSTSGNTGDQPKSLNYPFTILEIRENDVAPAAAPNPSA